MLADARTPSVEPTEKDCFQAGAPSSWICEWNGLLRELCWLQEADLSPRMTSIHCASAGKPSHSSAPLNTSSLADSYDHRQARDHRNASTEPGTDAGAGFRAGNS